MNQLSKRLQAIYNLVLPCDTLLEIGCDHCWLSIFIVKDGVAQKAIASDINQEPLESCKMNIKNTAELNVKTRISNGFVDIEEDFDSVVIAGMGAKLICNILGQRQDLKDKQLVLQPQKNEPILREYLKNAGLKVLDEVLTQDKGFTYTIISVGKAGKSIQNDLDIFVGPILKNNKSKIHLEKLSGRVQHLEKFVGNIKEEDKREEISQEIKVLKKFIDDYES